MESGSGREIVMHKRELRGWLKHIDFIVLDVVMLQVCFVLS